MVNFIRICFFHTFHTYHFFLYIGVWRYIYTRINGPRIRAAIDSSLDLDPTNQSSCICVSLLNIRHDCFHTMHPRNIMLDAQMDLELMLTLRTSPGFALSYVGTLQSMPLVVPSGVQSTANWHPGATRKVLEPGRCHRGQARQGEEPQNCPCRSPLPAEWTLWGRKWSPNDLQNDTILETWPNVKTALPSRRQLNYKPVDVSRRVPRNSAEYRGIRKTRFWEVWRA